MIIPYAAMVQSAADCFKYLPLKYVHSMQNYISMVNLVKSKQSEIRKRRIIISQYKISLS